MTVVESVYSAVRTGSLYKADCVSSLERLMLDSQFPTMQHSINEITLNDLYMLSCKYISFDVTRTVTCLSVQSMQLAPQ